MFIFIQKHYPSIAGSFKRYFRHLSESRIIEQLDAEIVAESQRSNLFVVDMSECSYSFIVKSIDGNDEVGPNWTDSGRNGNKVGLIADVHTKVIHRAVVTKANLGETNVLRELLRERFVGHNRILGDSGFIGHEIRKECDAKT